MVADELEKSGVISGVIETLILKGVANRAAGYNVAAVECTQRALELSATRGFQRVWIDEGEFVLPLLQQCVAASNGTTIALAHAGTLIAEILREQSAAGSVLPDVLSERELEVLRYLAAGHPNRIIANELYLAVGTVKKHTHSIFQKLNVGNRTQAVQRAHELHLL